MSAVTTPFFVICAIFGMNNDDLPAYVSWGYLLLACGVVSAAVFLIMLVNFYRGRPALKALKQERAFVHELKLTDRKPALLRNSMRGMDKSAKFVRFEDEVVEARQEF